MVKRISLILYGVLLVSTLVLAASAATGKGNLWVKLEVGDLPVINGAFTLYRVGTSISDGYRIGEELGGGFVREEDARSPQLAQWLSELEQKEGNTLLLDADGNVVFSNLDDGLYLLVQNERTDGFYPMQPLLLTIPEEGRRDISLFLEPLPMVADSPATGQDPTPYIGVIGLVISLSGMVFCTRGRKRR